MHVMAAQWEWLQGTALHAAHAAVDFQVSAYGSQVALVATEVLQPALRTATLCCEAALCMPHMFRRQRLPTPAVSSSCVPNMQ